MLYIVCPTCREILGNRQLLYEEQTELINKSKISDEEKDKQKQFIINELCELYCCKQRLMTYKNLVEIII
jgi:DNA-directed RNA polymerase subunit N (RpoN/RPB10)